MIYFLYGDTPLPLKYEELLKEIKNKNPGIEAKYFDGAQKEEEQFFEAVSINSMFASLELLVFKRMENVNLKSFIERLRHFNLSQKIVVLVYEEFLDEFDRESNPIDKREMKKIEEICKVLPAKKKNEKKAMIFYVSRELKLEEYKAEKVCEMIGEDFLKVKQEVAKLQNYFDGDDFSLEEAEKIISVNEEYSLRKSIELFLEKGDRETLLKCLAENEEYLLFLYSIYDELTLLLKIKALEKRGVIDKRTTYNHFKGAIYESVKEFFRRDNGRYISEYPIFLKFKLMEKFSLEFLKERMEEVVRTEFQIKSGQISSDVGIEKFILGFYREEEE